jgi:RimJ/RimL family protein N-acetyltransferase
MPVRSTVRIEPWGEADLGLLEKLNAPEMMEHLGGPETPEQLIERHGRYQRLPAETGRMFKIVDEATGEPVGSVGYWDRTWRGDQVYEIGWGVLPAYRGRGIAVAATGLAVARARADARHRFMHAFPSVANLPSNAICRKVGFTLVDECDFEYPPGRVMRCNDWRLDLLEARPSAGVQ